MNIYRNLACSCWGQSQDPGFAEGESTETPEIVLKSQQMALVARASQLLLYLEHSVTPGGQKKKVGGPAFKQLFRLQSHEKYVPGNEMLFIWTVPFLVYAIVVSSQRFLTVQGVIFTFFQRSTNEAWFLFAVFLFQFHVTLQDTCLFSRVSYEAPPDQLHRTGTEQVTREFQILLRFGLA